jgi:hypothetical protein
MRAIFVAEGEVLPECSACGDPRSMWFLVERAPRVERVTPPPSVKTGASAEQRSGVGN